MYPKNSTSAGRVARLLTPVMGFGVVLVLVGAGAAGPLQAQSAPPSPISISPFPAPAAAASPSVTLLTPVPSALPGAVAMDPPELRGVWVDAFHDGFKNPSQIDDLVAWARAANVNALYVEVRRRGDAYYLKGSEPITEDASFQPNFDALQYLIDRAHSGPQRLQVHAWLATLPIWSSQDTPPVSPSHVFNQHGPTASGNDNWLMLRDDGVAWAGLGDGTSGLYYLDPGNPAAAQYTANVYVDLARNYDVDGVHLDQVRYFEGDAPRWGYNPASVQRFNQRFGRDPATQPDPQDPDWMAWRRDQVTNLVRRVYLGVKAVKPQVAVSAAVIPWGSGPTAVGGWQQTAAYSRVFQDWQAWLQEGIVDYVLPMNYFRENDPQSGWFDNWVQWQESHVGTRSVVVGVGSYLNDADQAIAQIQRARAGSPYGIALYSYAVPTNDADDGDTDPSTARQTFANRLDALFPRPAPPPALPIPAGTGNLLVIVAGRDGALVNISGTASRTVMTDGNGAAGAIGLPQGSYSVTVTAPGISPAPTAATIQAGVTTSLRVPGP